MLSIAIVLFFFLNYEAQIDGGIVEYAVYSFVFMWFYLHFEA